MEKTLPPLRHSLAFIVPAEHIRFACRGHAPPQKSPSSATTRCLLFTAFLIHWTQKAVITMNTKDILRQLRVQKGLSQDELAEKLYVTRQAVSRWETGETTPNVETLKLLSRFFDVSINTLLGTPRALVCQCCGRCEPQPRAGRRVQRGLLQMVLPRRHVPVRKQGAAHRFLRRTHGHRNLAQRAGSRPHGSGRSPTQALEITKREADASHRSVCLSFCSGLLQSSPIWKPSDKRRTGEIV